MGTMVDGEWRTDTWIRDNSGHFKREPTKFHRWITADGSSDFPAESGRYHLYLSLACPWAHRTLIMRALKGLEDVISISIVHPFMGEDGWYFDDYPGAIADNVNNTTFLRDIYRLADPKYSGRVTVPILWDKHKKTIVNNESRQIIRMLNKQFDAFAKNKVDLAPDAQLENIEQFLDDIYEPINNGVYRAGFATQQGAYNEAVTQLFDALAKYDELLSKQRYLCGNNLTEADIALFTTLVRFDPVYHGHFKCNLRPLTDFPNLWNYVKDIYQHPKIGPTCNIDHIKHHYYASHDTINPTRIVPLGPELHFDEPHDRDRFTTK